MSRFRSVMTQSLLKVVSMFGQCLAIVVLCVSSYSPGNAQANRLPPPPSTINADGSSGEEKPVYASIEEEMRAKRLIAAAEKAHKENLERARSLAFLSTALAASFKEKKQLDREDMKKLEKAEKLAKGIRGAAGGSEDQIEMEKPPTDLPCAITLLAEGAASLKNRVDKTPKRVISTAVIDEANVLLELIRFIRTASSGRER